MIVRKSGRKTGRHRRDRQNNIIVLIAIVLALPPLNAKVVEVCLCNLKVGGGEWISSESARRQRIAIGEAIVAFSRITVQDEVLNSKPISQIKELQILRTITLNVGEAISNGDFTMVLESTGTAAGGTLLHCVYRGSCHKDQHDNADSA